MKMPKRPPVWYSIATERLGPLLTDEAIRGSDRYMHWDDLRHRKPPADCTTEEWWAALKVLRAGNRQTIGLVSTSQRPVSFVTPDVVNAALHRIDIGAGGTIVEAVPSLTAADRDRYITRSLVEEAITSSQLEGATTTRLVAKEMLRTGRAPRDRSERMILNNYRTMERIQALRSEELTPDLVMEIHRLVSDGTLDNPAAAGRLRTKKELIEVSDEYGEIFHTPPVASELPSRMEKMCAFANASNSPGKPFIHPVVRAIALHFWLAYDHPFVDGNGRTARALFYWSMLRSGYWLFEFVSISRLLLKAPTAYSRAFLLTETDDDDLTYFLLHQCGVIIHAIDDLHAYIKRKSAETRELAQELRAMQEINHRQQALVAHALRHRHSDYTIAGHQRSHGTAYATARADLLGLEELGLLTSQRRGHQLVFAAVRDLERRLRRAPRGS